MFYVFDGVNIDVIDAKPISARIIKRIARFTMRKYGSLRAQGGQASKFALAFILTATCIVALPDVASAGNGAPSAGHVGVGLASGRVSEPA